MRGAQGAELLGAVLAQVPRVARALGALGRQREDVGRRHVGRPAGLQHALDVLEHAVGVLDVLDRLQEDDRVARLREGLDHVAHEAQVGRAVAQARVLVRVGVGVDADHAVGAARPGRRRRSPRRTRGRRRAPRRRAWRSTRRRRGGGETSSSPRGRRGACARRRGRAAGRPGGWSRCWKRSGTRGGSDRERVHVAAYTPAPCRPRPPTAEEIRDVNARYHDGAAADYDAKWGIDFGAVGQGRCWASCARRSGGGRAASTARWRSAPAPATSALNLLQAGVVGDAVCTDISPGMLEALQRQRRAAGPRRRDRGLRRRAAAVRRRVLRPRLRPRGPAPPARPRPGLRRVPPRAAPGRAARSSPASRRATATGSPRCPSARRYPGAALAAADARAPAARGHRDGGGPTIKRSRPSSTCTPSRPTSWPLRAARRPRRRPRPRRGAAGQLVRLGQPRAGGDADPDDGPVGLAAYAFRGYLALQQVDSGCSSRACRRRSSTT